MHDNETVEATERLAPKFGKPSPNAADEPMPFWRRAVRAVDHATGGAGRLALLNTSIIPPGADGAWEVREVTLEEAQRLVSCAIQCWCETNVGLTTHIGHEATAAVATALLGQQIKVDRSPWDGVGPALALQLKGRIPEGAILTREQMEEIGYSWRVLLPTKSREADLEAALRAFMQKMPAIERAQEEIYRCAHLHGLVYDGPTYIAEMQRARQLLGLPAVGGSEQPTGPGLS